MSLSLVNAKTSEGVSEVDFRLLCVEERTTFLFGPRVLISL